ncbi:MAG: hydantoinase B/oxoprolinase family protein [Candidatus Promineifilaceae bacterium]|nr:hydantoinase B/oxoprolinase family protein [Candidatus Promineifilaceae bacterium]
MTAPAATLSIFNHLFASVAEEMGVTLGRAGYSPNIKERLDYSCAVFLGDGRMLAQAAHIPVHLGAMPASVRAAIRACAPFRPGDVIILNDPYLGGTHLPDVTLVSPVFIDVPPGGEQSPNFFVASRAHHADVGGTAPGSMPLSTELYQEGLIIPPLRLVDGGERNQAVWQLILRNVRTPAERDGDLAAQLAAHTTGARRLSQITDRYGLEEMKVQADELLSYAERLTRAAIREIPPAPAGKAYTFRDYLDDDGHNRAAIPIQVAITVEDGHLDVDFTGTAPAVQGNLNAVPAIVHSAVAYCVRCVALALLQTDVPMNEGAFTPMTLRIPPGSLLDPRPPHAVAAGNVETSQRIVDVVFGALAEALPELIPAASQGTMNNLTFGGTYPDDADNAGETFAYYETLGGGIGAGPDADGGHGMHAHMSNTRNTPVEALEYAFPLRVQRYALRHDSGGTGRHQGGDGLIRSIRYLSPVTVTITSERRERSPYGLRGGAPGAPGRNLLLRDGHEQALSGKVRLDLEAGDVLRLETPGGGGWGRAKPAGRQRSNQ